MNEIPTKIKNKKLVTKRREQIIIAAIKLFAEKGYHETTLRDLSEEAGISYGNIYDYIGSKEDILFLMHDYLCTIVFLELDKTMAGTSDPREKLRRMVKVEFNFMDRYSDVILTMYQEGRVLKETQKHKFLGKEHDHVNKFDLVIQEGIQQGSIEACNTRLSSNILKCMIDSWVLKRWDLRGYSTRLEAEEAILQGLFNGLLPQAGPDSDCKLVTDPLRGKSALVVNGATVLGSSICSFLGSAGVNLHCQMDRSPNHKILSTCGIRFEKDAMRTLTSDEHGPMTPDLFEAIDREQGHIDVYIQDLGLGYIGAKHTPYASSGADTPGRILERHLRCAREMAECLVEYFSKRKYGNLVFLAPWAWDYYADSFAYETVTAGTIALTRSLAKALAPYQVNVNCIVPGFIKTPRPTQLQSEKLTEVTAKVPFKKCGEIEDIIGVLKFLAGDSAKYLTGETLHVNGGKSSPR